MESFPRPRYLLGFNNKASEELMPHVKEWLLEAGLQIDLDGLGAKVIGRSPFLVVSAERSALELEAERLGYIKPHRALRPHVKDQDYGKIEFEGQPDEWVKGYIGYEEHDFWLPCERVQLLRHRIEEVPAPKEQMKQLKVRHSTALAVSDRLLPALKIAGLVDCMVPMDDDINDDLGKERRSMWKEAIWMALTPVDRIQRYFGSEVALYFAWLNHFTLWLVAPAAVGLLFYLRMHFFGFTVDDDPFLPFYSLFVVFWGMCFLRSWDRHCAVQAWHWNVHGVENRPEHRAEFVGELRTSRVTGQLHRYYPEGKRFLAYALSVLVTSLMLAISFCVMICSLNLQGFMEESVTSLEQIFYIAPLARLADHGAIFDPNQKEYFGLLAFGPIVLHVFAIMNLNKLYRSVAEWLTEQENHELLEHHQSSLMAKRFMFEAFDCYIVLFYVGFVQQDIRKLRQELLCLYGVDSLRRVFVESILPLVLELISKRQLSRKAAELKRPERDMRKTLWAFAALAGAAVGSEEMACQADGSCEKPKNKGGGVVLLQGVKRHGKVQEHLQSEDEECTPLGGDPYYPYFRECCQGTKQCGPYYQESWGGWSFECKHSCNKKEKEDDCGCVPPEGWSTTVQKCRPESTTSEAEAKECRDKTSTTASTTSTSSKAAEADDCGCIPPEGWSTTVQKCRIESSTSEAEAKECRDKTSTTVSTASTTTGPTTTWTGGTGPTPTVLTIMSWNVFFGNTRYDAMDRMFKAHDVDIANLQETNNKLANIAEASGYASVNEWKQPHDWCGYNFHKPDWGHAWATELEVPGSRGVCGAMMYKGDAKFCVWGLHPIQRNNNVKYAKESIKIAADAMKKCSEEYNAPSIFLGDFNTLDWRGAQHELEKRTGWGWQLAAKHDIDFIFIQTYPLKVGEVISSQIVGDGTCWLEQAHFLEALEVLDQPHYEQFDDFLEMVIEFGYVTLFASAFPLAAVVSLVSNLIELKSDMFKLACVYQRPISHRMKSIGIWRQLLHIIAGISIITNVMIFVMSEQLASWTPSLYREASLEDVQQGRLASAVDQAAGTADLVIRQGAGRYVIFFAAVLEHLVAVAVVVLMLAIPSTPDWVKCEIRRTMHFKDMRAKAAADSRKS
ncbi:Anoctamin-10 (Transmembrane protein 16K) [Durusdinium trenchii]|uniref:Anoctamin-10 (Transmembrane protein 16K) n=1 Tax=Durusdinium trenchii TaxID=1381693 RepID=A0ABP0MQH1_9DINO